MSSSMDWFIGVLITVMFICILALGFALGTESVVDDCQAFGAFKAGNQQYVCSVDKVVK